MAILYDYDIKLIFSSHSTHQLLSSMSHLYRYTFLEQIIRLRLQLLKEVDQLIKSGYNSPQPFKADVGASEN